MPQLAGHALFNSTRTRTAIAVCTVLSLAATASAQSNIVLAASSPSAQAGGWSVASDSGAFQGTKIRHLDSSAAKVLTAAVSPTDYFELTFSAIAGVPYHLWVHGRADGDDWDSDSVYVQFSGSVTASGAEIFRIGTASATTVNLEECRGCRVKKR